MATTERDIYKTAFDEDVQPTTNQCPECDGRVTTNAVETVCDDCGLLIDDQSVDPDSKWRSRSGDDRKRGILLTAQGDGERR